MVSPALAEPVKIKNSGKSPDQKDPDIAKSHNRTSNISRLLSPPQGQSIPFSKSQPKSAVQNKSASSPNNRPLLSTSSNTERFLSSNSFGSLDQNLEAFVLDLPTERKAEIVKKHLVTGEDLARSSENSYSTDPLSLYSTSHKLPGGDATHAVYKWHNDVESEPLKRTRSRSLYLPRPTDPDTSNIREPGGFRRHHVLMKARKEGKKPPNMITRNFIDFLAMYGHFAGEDLSDDEDLSDEEVEEGEEVDVELLEATPLISRDGHATASPSKAVFLLLKSFVGTGVMFLPKAFYNGGMVFSTLVLVSIAAISLCAFLLLVETRVFVPYSFGDIGGILYGRWMRLAVLFSITISQIGFVCAYMIFVAENLAVVFDHVLGIKDIGITWFIVGQTFVFVPLAMIRRISRLSFTALIADAFIMFGLLYLYYYDIFQLSTDGVGEIVAFNSKDFALFIGTAVFTFEGIGLIIPITESMKEPEKFPKVLTYVMLFITALFTSIGVLSYATFGKDVQTVVILNLPSTPIVQSVQLLYALAILLSIPLQLFPAIRIMEQGIFERSGKNDPWVKWQKNLFRLLMVAACAVIAWGGASDLDKFVSLIGSFACVPLCFLYPPLFHFKAAAHTLKAKLIDLFVFLFGLFSLFYTTYINLVKWGEKKP